jgi:hypothetical protein
MMNFFKIGSRELFVQGWLWTLILLISASRVAKITDVSHWSLTQGRLTLTMVSDHGCLDPLPLGLWWGSTSQQEPGWGNFSLHSGQQITRERGRVPQSSLRACPQWPNFFPLDSTSLRFYQLQQHQRLGQDFTMWKVGKDWKRLYYVDHGGSFRSKLQHLGFHHAVVVSCSSQSVTGSQRTADILSCVVLPVFE